MGIFDTATVKVIDNSVQLHSTDTDLINRITNTIKIISKNNSYNLEINDSIPDFVIISQFKNHSKMIDFSDWIMDFLEKDKWTHNNHDDILYPEYSHFKKLIKD
ncbi:MAG: hypothetical protein C0410_01980 [Anaerolinea sp.]|nr:hypothetical protein [Anaerolinea sp.]